MLKKVLFAILVVTVLCGGALGYEGQDMIGEYAIMIGIPTINGVISEGEWDNANWLELDKEYWLTADDLTEARWAAMWSPETNLIYVVVRGIDTYHVFGEGYLGKDDWNRYDISEVYIDLPNSDVNPYQHLQDPAQQWMSGNDTNDGRWIMLPVEHVYTENPLDDEFRPEFMSTVDGNLYVYEYAFKPYESFGWNTGRETKVFTLEDDLVVGLDVIMSSKSGSFGMLCENAWSTGDDLDGDGEADGVISVGKWNYANRFLDHCLVSDPNRAWRPRPGNKSVDAGSEVELKWNAGRDAAQHHIYFGSDFEDVNSASDPTLAPIGKGIQPRANNTYEPNDCPLRLGQTYYWRIDEVNGASYCRGNVWRFRVVNYHVFEDFDSYVDTEELRIVWNDGWINEETGSEVSLETEPYYTRDGNSAGVSYYNDWYYRWYYSEIAAETSSFEIGSNLTVDDVKALTLWFHGEADNDLQPMYVALDDGDNIATVLYDDLNDLKYPYWKEWNIDLQEFADGDVVLSNVEKIYIGFGDEEDLEVEEAEGYVWFDDIRLYRPRCVPAEARADFTGDCITDMAELEIMAGDWQDSDFTVEVNEPNDANLLLWYEFDEASGFDAFDSSGNGYTGDVEEDDWTEGYIDGALDFNSSTSEVIVPMEAFSTVTTQITIALWQYGDEFMQPQEDNLFEGTKDYSNQEIRILNVHLPSVDGSVYWDAGNPNDIWDANVWRQCDRIYKEAEFSEYAGQWNHWAFVKDCDANGGSGVMKMYLNGLLWHIGYGEPNGLNEPMTGDIDNFYIGKGFDASYAGRIDDFRMYNRELSAEEIAWLATSGTGYYPLQSRTANIYLYLGEEDEIIDFKDFAVLADYWLEEVLFPSP